MYINLLDTISSKEIFKTVSKFTVNRIYIYLGFQFWMIIDNVYDIRLMWHCDMTGHYNECNKIWNGLILLQPVMKYEFYESYDLQLWLTTDTTQQK